MNPRRDHAMEAAARSSLLLGPLAAQDERSEPSDREHDHLLVDHAYALDVADERRWLIPSIGEDRGALGSRLRSLRPGSPPSRGRQRPRDLHVQIGEEAPPALHTTIIVRRTRRRGGPTSVEGS